MAKRSQKVRAEHFAMAKNYVACLHCGVRQDFLPVQGLPCTVKALKAAALLVDDFYDRHAKCACTAASPLVQLERDEHEWARGLFVGESSATIFKAMTGRWPAGHMGEASLPYDSGDFGRCHRLLLVKPEWRARLGEVAAKYQDWAPLVSAWDELTALYEAKDYQTLYARITALRGEVKQ
jgi:predicted ATPase